MIGMYMDVGQLIQKTTYLRFDQLFQIVGQLIQVFGHHIQGFLTLQNGCRELFSC